jgi:4-hydroxy-3-polyprenylbenzoate decarboxylase
VLALRLIEVLRGMQTRVDTIVSRAAMKVAESECVSGEFLLSKLRELGADSVYLDDELDSPLSSSSYVTLVDWVAVVPASIKTIASIVYGLSDNLVARVALNALRLGKRVIVVPRESPLGEVELRVLYRAARAGIHVVPATVGFYTKPETLTDVVNFVVGKILDVAGVKHQLYPRWPSTRKTGEDLCSKLYLKR